MDLKIESISYDPKYYPRVNGKEDWVTVCRYAEALRAGAKFPPIRVVKMLKPKDKRKPWLLLDGLHRLRTYYKSGRKEIPAVVERLPQSRWLARSVELNIAGKRALDDGDKTWCAMRLREDGFADKNIAQLLCLTVDRLERIIVERVVRIDTSKAEAIPLGRSNRSVDGENMGFLKAPFAGQELSPDEEIQALQEQPPIASRNDLNILDSAIALLSCGVDMTREDVAERIGRLHTLVRGLVGK